MAQTVIRGSQILNNTVQRQDMDTATVGQAVVTKLVQGSGITLSSTGADSGTGDVTVSSPDAVSTDAGNIATLGSDNHILVPQSQIWDVRLRSFNTVGNPNFGVTQRNIGGSLTNPNGFIEDRWSGAKTGTLTYTAQVVNAGFAGIILPGTNFTIAKNYLRVTLTGQQASLAAGDFLQLYTVIEGARLLELVNDVHSLSLLVRSSVAGLSFGAALSDSGPVTKSLTKLCTLGAVANTWTLITLPNLPIFPSAGNFSTAPGQLGYYLTIALAVGSTNTSPANNTWQNGNFIGAVGQSNFAASPVNSTFDIVFVQHEPSAQCSTPIDCPFTQNYDQCLRYFYKTFDYDVAIGTASANSPLSLSQISTTEVSGPVRFPKAMAKIPTCTAYNGSTGAANSIRLGGANYAVSSFDNVGKGGFFGIITAAMPAVALGAFGWCHYTADTGW